MTIRRDLIAMLAATPKSVSALARELGLRRDEAEDHLQHAIQSARAAGHRVVVVPAKCRQCGFTFGEQKLSKPGKCPECKASRIVEAQVRIE